MQARSEEFQKHFKLVQHSHREALHAMRQFWRTLVAADVSFGAIMAAFQRIAVAQAKTEAVYQTVLERHPREPKVRCPPPFFACGAQRRQAGRQARQAGRRLGSAPLGA